MPLRVTYIERKDGASPSIERVFRSVARCLQGTDVSSRFEKVRFGNGILGTLLNLATFRTKGNSDIFHITGHITYLGLLLPRKNTVVTIHDLAILDRRTGLRRWLIAKLYYVWPTRRLRYVTAISEATKDKLVKLANLQPEKVRVIENPVLVSESQGSRVFNEKQPSVLQVGTAPNKNVERVASAVASLGLSLRIIGPISDALRSHLRSLTVSVTNDEYLSDIEMEQAYIDADIVAFCSTDEGFGLPIIEAQAKGRAVVTSARSPMKEVAGAGAVLVDPESVDSIREGLKIIAENAEIRERKIRAGRENIRRFAPEAIALQYRNLYRFIESKI